MIDHLLDNIPAQVSQIKERKLSNQAQSISDDFHDANTIDTNQFGGENEQYETGKNYEFLNLISVDYFEDFDEVVQKQRLEKFKKQQKRRNRMKGKHGKQEKNTQENSQNSQNNPSILDQSNNQIPTPNSSCKTSTHTHKKSKNKSPSMSRSFQEEQQFAHDLIEIIHQTTTEVNKNNKQKQSEKMCEIYRETLNELQNTKVTEEQKEEEEEINTEIAANNENNSGFQEVEKKKYYLTKIDKSNWHLFHKQKQKQPQPQQIQPQRYQEQKSNYKEIDDISYNRKCWKEIKRQKDYQYDKYYKQSKNPKYFQKKKVIDYESQYKESTNQGFYAQNNFKSHQNSQKIWKQFSDNTKQFQHSKKKKDQAVQACLELQSLENITDYQQIVPNSYLEDDGTQSKRLNDSFSKNKKVQTSTIKYEKYLSEIKSKRISDIISEKSTIINECDIFNCQNELNQPIDFMDKSLHSLLNQHIKNFSSDCEAKQQKLIKLVFSKHLEEFLSLIDQQNSKLFVIRKIVFLRLQYIVKQLFFGINQNAILTQYGSTTTSLSLPTSDLDLLVTGFGFLTKFQTQQFLSTLQSILQQFKWIVEVNPIFTANVPILKLKIDPFIDFNQTRTFQQNFILHPFASYSNFNIRNKSSFPETIMNIDISMETLNEINQIPTSVGIKSTKLIQSWIDAYPHLQQLALVLKSVLQKYNLNKAFFGGMSSYTLIIMIIAFLKHKKIGYQLKLFQVLKEFCYFYAFEFKPESQGIRLSMNDQEKTDTIFTLQNKIETNKIIIYEPITNSSHFSSNIEINKIFPIFKKIYQKIELIENQIKDYCNEEALTLGQFLEISSLISLYKQAQEITANELIVKLLNSNFLEEFTNYGEQKKNLFI